MSKVCKYLNYILSAALSHFRFLQHLESSPIISETEYAFPLIDVSEQPRSPLLSIC